jgi:hypothetical protein
MKIADHVYKVDNENRYVLKVVPFRSKADKQSFLNELIVGTTDGIEKVGVRVHAYAQSKRRGLILMDHVERGRKRVESMTATQYLRRFPDRTNNFLKQLKRCLTAFYNLTHRFHGDLHLDNVMVVHDNNNKKRGLVVEEEEEVRLIDYGSTVPIIIPITTNVDLLLKNKPKTYSQWTRLIRNTFDGYPSTTKTNTTAREYHPPGSKVEVKRPLRGEGAPFRMNQNVLRYYIRQYNHNNNRDK